MLERMSDLLCAESVGISLDHRCRFVGLLEARRRESP